MDKNIAAHSNKCSGCGGGMVYNPDTGKLLCNACAREKEIEQAKNYQKHNYIENENKIEVDQAWAQDGKYMKCPNCGAEVVLKNFDISSACPYCSSALVASNDNIHALKPDAVIPFKFGKQKAEALFKAKIKKNWFAPKKFKQSIKADEIQSYYFPAFVFDADSFSVYSGRLYKEERYTDSEGDSRTRRRYFNIKGEKSTSHRGIEVEASTKLEQQELNWVRPYDFNDAVSYNNDFISGFCLECYSSSLNETEKQAKELIKKEIQAAILNQYNYDGVSSLNIDSNFSNEKYAYCALPMYRINYTYKDKKYSNVMNGQTGALGGKIPKSPWKIGLTALPIIITILIFVLFVILM